VNPKKLTTRQVERTVAVERRAVAEKYLEVAELVADEDGAAVNVAVGLAVLAGVAAGDAICVAATGERYAGQDHAGAADLLSKVDIGLGKRLRTLVGLKAASHYGDALLNPKQRTAALSAARALVRGAADRTT
jgi:hypothetical protein